MLPLLIPLFGSFGMQEVVASGSALGPGGAVGNSVEGSAGGAYEALDRGSFAGSSEASYSVLVFTKTEGFRHDSIPKGIEMVRALGEEHGFGVIHTEDSAMFSWPALRDYAVVVFMNTSGDVLDDQQQEAFERYIRAGGGYVGVHAAADTEFDWPWYGDLVGAYFDSHPRIQEADIAVLDRAFPATAHLPVKWTRTDEWYNYRANPRGTVHVLATLIEKSYEGGTMGDDHPIAWAHEHDGGRAFYTGGGHTIEAYDEPLFREHVLEGIRWAAGEVEGDTGPTLKGSYEEVILDGDTTYPMQLEVAPDGRVFWIERDGAVKIWNPSTESTVLAAHVPVSSVIEDGLLGIALDPHFEESQWVYLYYTPMSEDPNRLSRFTMRGNALDLSSEVVMLEVFMQRKLCCHSAGELNFDHEGHLWLSTGDNTGGSAPRTDERPGRALYDAQRTSANTNDLRGKILRIHPEPDGSYTIPDGNLFAGDDDPRTRPEIYTMGHRNPWRHTVDAKTGWMYWGDVGPGNPYMEGRMPEGMEEFGQAKRPGFFGWPYFVGPNAAYRDYDFETEEYGDWFDPDNPVNDSPNNTGLTQLPPAQPAWIHYGYGPSSDYPEMGLGGMSAAPGFVYRYDSETAGEHALPPYFDGKVMLFEWARNWIQEVLNDEDGDVMEITAFTPEIPYIRPIDVALGPDGRLYVLEWGETFWGQNRDGQLVRVDYHGSERRPPIAAASVSPESGPVPLEVTFDGSGSMGQGDGSGSVDPGDGSRSMGQGNGSGSTDPGGGVVSFGWDFDGDGTVDATGARVTHVYTEPGTHVAMLTVTDAGGMNSTDQATVTVGNTAPQVTILWPPAGGIVPFDEPVPYEVRVTDPEDGVIESPGPRVTLQPYLGHDTHEHPLHAHRGNVGTFKVVPDFSHKPYIIDHWVRIVANYADRGLPSLSASDEATLYPRVVQAENYSDAEGANLVITGNRQRPTFAHETEVYVELEHGEYVSLGAVNLHGIEAISLHLVPEAPGRVWVRLDRADGPVLVEAEIAPPEQEVVEEREDGPPIIHWVEYRLPIEAPEGAHDLYFVFEGPEEDEVARFDRIVFEGPGTTDLPEGIQSPLP